MTAPEVQDKDKQTEQWVWVARIRRTQGRKGEVFAEILTDFPEKFANRKKLWLLSESRTLKSAKPGAPPAPPREIELVESWLHKGGIVLHFAGVDDISAAETLAGLIVAIPLTERTPLNDGEVYIADLVGCTLFDVASGKPVAVGVVEEVDRHSGPVDILIIQGATGEVLIPFAKSYLPNLNIPAKRLEMALPEGLVDLNPPEKVSVMTITPESGSR